MPLHLKINPVLSIEHCISSGVSGSWARLNWPHCQPESHDDLADTVLHSQLNNLLACCMSASFATHLHPSLPVTASDLLSHLSSEPRPFLLSLTLTFQECILVGPRTDRNVPHLALQQANHDIHRRIYYVEYEQCVLASKNIHFGLIPVFHVLHFECVRLAVTFCQNRWNSTARADFVIKFHL